MNLFKSTIAPAGLAAALLMSSSCSRTEVEAAEQTKAVSQMPTVPVAEATLTPMSHGESLTAEFRPFQEVDVMAKVAGYVRKIHVDVGDRVEQGQALAELEIPEMADDLARAQAGVARAQGDVVRARDELQRAESAHQMAHLSGQRMTDVSTQRPGLVAQQEVDDAHSRDLIAEAQLQGAQSALAAAELQVRVSETEVKRVQTMMDYTRITAPFTGIATKRYADTGSMLQAGTSSNALPLIRLSENSLLRLTVPVPESMVPSVHLGQQVDVRVQTLNRSFKGRVARFADKVEQATRTMDTEIDVPNPSGVLIPGMFAEVDLTVDQRASVLTIPIPAVDLGQDESSGQVTVVTPEGRIEIRKVKLGQQDASNIEVLEGLTKGDRVVTSNRTTLRAGQEVRPKLVAMGTGSVN
jgi:RND family efflux transporter MFP subunit